MKMYRVSENTGLGHCPITEMDTLNDNSKEAGMYYYFLDLDEAKDKALSLLESDMELAKDTIKNIRKQRLEVIHYGKSNVQEL